MIQVYTGLPGSGKTTMLVRKTVQLMEKNLQHYKRTKELRKVYNNLPLTPLIEKRFGPINAKFTDIYQMPTWRNCDIAIDELAVYFDSQEWEKTSMEVKGFLRLHRHYKINIWGVAQDFLTVDKSFRRLCAHLYHIDRIVGFGEPKFANKGSKHPFVLSKLREVDPLTWEVEKEYYKFIPLSSSYELFTKKDFQNYDTHAELPEQSLPPLKREQRHWYKEDGTIGFTRTKYF